jgi:hypothetical protein
MTSEGPAGGGGRGDATGKVRTANPKLKCPRTTDDGMMNQTERTS